MSIQDKAAALRALVFRETEVDPKCEVLVYALRGVSFKGGRVCPGFRAFYGEEAYKKLCSRIPREFSEAVEAVRFRLDHFNELRDGYYTEGLVFVDLDEKGRAYVHDPDTDGRVYLPSLAAHHPDAVYNLDFIPMDQIRVLEEVRYRSSYDVEDLAENIRRYGLLNPLVVFRDKKVYSQYRKLFRDAPDVCAKRHAGTAPYCYRFCNRLSEDGRSKRHLCGIQRPKRNHAVEPHIERALLVQPHFQHTRGTVYVELPQGHKRLRSEAHIKRYPIRNGMQSKERKLNRHTKQGCGL